MSGSWMRVALPMLVLLTGCVNHRESTVAAPGAGFPAAPAARANEAGVVRDPAADQAALLGYAARRMTESQAALGRGETDAAIHGFREVVGIRPHCLEAHLALARAYRARGSVAGAVAALERVLELDAAHRDSRLELAALRVQMGRHASALTLIESLAASLDHEPGSLVVLGEALVGTGRSEEAQVYFRRALQLDGRCESAWRGVISFHALAGNQHRIEQLAREMVKTGVPADRVLAAAGDECWRGGLVERAQSLYQMIGDVAGDTVLAYERTATLLARTARCNEAIEYARAGMVLHPQDPSLRFALAAAHAAAGRHETAILHLRKLLKQHPVHADARVALARSYRALGEPLPAIIELQRALSFQALDPVLYQELGMACQDYGQPEMAHAAFQSARDLDPEGRFVFAATDR